MSRKMKIAVLVLAITMVAMYLSVLPPTSDTRGVPKIPVHLVALLLVGFYLLMDSLKDEKEAEIRTLKAESEKLRSEIVTYEKALGAWTNFEERFLNIPYISDDRVPPSTEGAASFKQVIVDKVMHLWTAMCLRGERKSLDAQDDKDVEEIRKKVGLVNYAQTLFAESRDAARAVGAHALERAKDYDSDGLDEA